MFLSNGQSENGHLVSGSMEVVLGDTVADSVG